MEELGTVGVVAVDPDGATRLTLETRARAPVAGRSSVESSELDGDTWFDKEW